MILIFFDSNKILKNSKQNKLESNNFFFKERNLEIIIKSKYILEFVYIIRENLLSIIRENFLSHLNDTKLWQQIIYYRKLLYKCVFFIQIASLNY